MEFWGNGSAAAKALTAAFVEGETIRIADPADLFMEATVGVLAATRVEIRAQVAEIGTTDWITLPVARVEPDYTVFAEGVVSIDGALGTVPVFWHVPGECDLRFQARRIGGGATTTLYLEGLRRYNRDSPSYVNGMAAGAGASATVMDRAYDSVQDAFRTVDVAPPQSDRNLTPQVMADATDPGGTPNYPSDNGHPLSDRAWDTLALQIRHGTLTIEGSMDRVMWTDITASFRDLHLSTTGHASFAEVADAAIVQFLIDMRDCGVHYIRFHWVPVDATSNVKVLLTERVM